MIRIDRNRLVDGQPIHPGQAWKDKADAETASARLERGEHEVKGGIYADERVRAALEALTGFKCAYCETTLDRVDWDIEHFRPKGRVKERPEHPGYYWLAYEWTNLLPACTYCNQNRKEKPVFAALVAGDSGGKLDQFPIADEAKRAMDHDQDIALEQRLLIDPTIDDPAEHLAYLPNGEIFALNGSPAGQKSIEVFRLNLFRIKRSRRMRLELLPHLLTMQRLAVRSQAQALLVEIEGMLEKLAQDAAPFAGMIRYFVRNPAGLGID
jgi:uncharacterized protein (TIGR02646 family)